MSLPVTVAASVAVMYHSLITNRKERNGGRDKATTVSKAVNCFESFYRLLQDCLKVANKWGWN
jgi:hypothetical protein